MKKLISLILAICTCLSLGVLLTACDDGSEEEVVVTTVASTDEWKNLFLPTNCTVNGSYVEGGQNETVTIKVADGKWTYTVVEPDETFGACYLLKDGAWHFAEHEEGVWGELSAARWLSDKGSSLTIGDVWERFYGYENEFDSFSYDEGLKAYVQVKEKSYYDANLDAYVDREVAVYVENGKLAKIEYFTDMNRQSTEASFMFVDYGTTVVAEFV